MWRGPEQNGVSREKNLISSWDAASGENVVWSNKDLATRSTPIILRGKLYTLTRSEPDTPREGERVVCADAATGKLLWENKFNIYLSDVPKERVAWSSVVADPATGRIYAMGVNGYTQCLDGDTGKTLWSHSLNEEFGLLSTYGGRTNIPLVFEDLLITSAVITNWGELSIPAHRFIAMNKHTGEIVWFNGTGLRPEETTYSTPIITTFNGQAAMVFGSGDGCVWAFQPRTGKAIWNYKITLRGVNVTPVVDGNSVYVSQSEENPDGNTQGQVLAIRGDAATGGKDITETGALWSQKGIMIGRSSMVKVGDRLYGGDDSGNIYTFDAKTGEPVGKRVKLAGSIMRASLTYADGKIYACTVNVWHVLEPTDKGVKVTHRFRFPEGEEVHGSPIVSHGRVYLPTTERMFCLGSADAKPSADSRPELVAEAPLTDKTAAHVQIAPVEALIKPGEKVQYKIRLYNALGQFIEERDSAEFALTGPGKIDGNGLYTADDDAKHSGVVVKVKVGEATGQARIRVIPPLPWKFDFASKEIPVTWIGMRYRHQVREVDGRPVMVKITTIPKGMKSQGWFGPIDLHDYTIQADVRGATKENKMPDIGLIAQRYTIDLQGRKQELQIRSWASELERFSKTIAHSWTADKWYTLKLRASIEDGKSVLRGKVWERGASEPEAWTIEAIDAAGNLQGSPGMFGNATDAEIFIDNITVTAN